MDIFIIPINTLLASHFENLHQNIHLPTCAQVGRARIFAVAEMGIEGPCLDNLKTKDQLDHDLRKVWFLHDAFHSFYQLPLYHSWENTKGQCY